MPDDMSEDARIKRLADAIRALAAGNSTPQFAAGDDARLGEAERAFCDLLARLNKDDTESNVAISSLATANVRLLLWNEALQKVNRSDALLYQGGDTEAFYRQVLADAMEMTRARYGALGLYDRDGAVVRFITLGMDAAFIEAIGHPPVGKGLLGAVLNQTTVLRVDDIAAHADACGFPPGHPPMKTLMGIPLRVGGKVKGALYMADKEGGELLGDNPWRIPDVFTEEDEIMLALFGDYLARELERMHLMQMLKESNGLLEKERAELEHLVKRLNEAQNQLLQSEKMASIGQLAAGVAHEINNPVGFINSNLGSLERYLKSMFAILDAYEQAQRRVAGQVDCADIEALKRDIDFDFLKEDIVSLMRETKDGVARVTKIVQDLKDFSHVDEAEWQLADVHKGLDSTLNVVWNELKYKAEVKKEYDVDMPDIECLPGQLNQVFMNLLVNAAHAIKERGAITVRTGHAAEEAWVEVADTGCGIPPENLTRIFDPFFTTKPVGKGTGLGLSLSYGIVQKHHGRIEVTSEVGRGTSFRIVLPLRQPGAPQEKA